MIKEADVGIHFLGEEIYAGTAVILVVLGLFLIVQLFNTINRIQDTSRWRFLILILVFFFYTLTSIFMPDSLADIETIEIAGFALGRGVILGIYYTHYVIKELSIQETRYFSVKWLSWSCLATFMIAVVAYLIQPDGIRAMTTVLRYLPVWMSVYFTVIVFLMVFRRLKTNINHNVELWSILLIGYLGIIFVSSMTVSVAFDDLKYVNVILANIGLFFTMCAYFMKHFYQVRKEREWLERFGVISEKGQILNSESISMQDFGLTPREIEITQLILEGLKYDDLAEELFISPKTVSKHASNIFRKCDVKNKEGLISLFSNPNHSERKLHSINSKSAHTTRSDKEK